MSESRGSTGAPAGASTGVPDVRGDAELTGGDKDSRLQRVGMAVADLLPYRISIARREQPRLTPVPRRYRLFALRAFLVAALATIGLAAIAPAGADTSGSNTATINVAVRSIIVSPSTATYLCGGGGTQPLTFPNALCSTGTITVTNGPGAGHVDANGSDAIPSDLGTHWVLCDNSTVACTGSGAGPPPGQDQFREQVCAIGCDPFLTDSTTGDDNFGSGGAATAGESVAEFMELTGPSASTDNSATFTTVITWTALP